MCVFTPTGSLPQIPTMTRTGLWSELEAGDPIQASAVHCSNPCVLNLSLLPVQYVLAESWTQERSQDLNAGIRDASVPRSILLAGPDDSFWLFLIKLNSSDDILCFFVYFVPLIVYPMLRPSVCPSNNPSQLSSLCVYEWLLLHVHFVYKETVDSNSIFHQQAVSLSSTSSLRLRGLSHEA